MKKYHFAIDESGNFSFESKSFVCGILISKDEHSIKQKYQKIFQRLYPELEIPQSTNELIGKKQFHYSHQSDEQIQLCKEELLPLAERIFVSTGKPLMYANNQSYWQIAVTAVILQLFKDHPFEKSDTLNILIDFRADFVWGVIDFEKIDFIDYHNKILRKQFDEIIESYRASLGIEINIIFCSDTASFFVNLADVICGVSRDPLVKK